MEQNNNSKKNELCKAAESIGKFIEYWGFKSIHGRIWALIYLSKNPISTPEIVEALKISKASASIGINDLIEHSLITASGKVKNGGVTYVSNENAGEIVRSVLRERELKMVTDTESELIALSSLSNSEKESYNISEEKLVQLLELTRTSKKILTKITNTKFKSIPKWSSFFKKAILWIS